RHSYSFYPPSHHHPPLYLLISPHPKSTLFPYTTLFRSPPPSPSANLMKYGKSLLSPLTILIRASPLKVVPSYLKLINGLPDVARSEEHTSELQSRENLVCRLLLEKTKLRI